MTRNGSPPVPGVVRASSPPTRTAATARLPATTVSCTDPPAVSLTSPLHPSAGTSMATSAAA